MSMMATLKMIIMAFIFAGTRTRSAHVNANVRATAKHIRRLSSSAGGEWVLIMSQNMREGNLPYYVGNSSVATTGLLNENTPTNPNYCILSRLEQYRRRDGSLKLSLVWPTQNMGPQIWSQTSNPWRVRNRNVAPTGYVAVDVSTTANGFQGLRWNGVQAMLDGVSGNRFWYSVGYLGINMNIPGPARWVPSVQLYAWMETGSLPSTRPTVSPSISPSQAVVYVTEYACPRGTRNVMLSASCALDLVGCEYCPVGHKCAGGLSVAVACGANEYQDVTGQDFCKSCPPGYTSNAGSSMCNLAM